MPGIAGPSAGERRQQSATTGKKHQYEPDPSSPSKPAKAQQPAAQAQPAEAPLSSAAQPRPKVTTVYGTSRRGPNLGMPSAAFVVAMVASAAMHQVDLTPQAAEPARHHSHQNRPSHLPVPTYTERLLATYERRLTNGYKRTAELVWPGLGAKHDDRHASKKEQQHRQRKDNEHRKQQEQHECARIGSRADCKSNPDCAYDSSRGCYKPDRREARKEEPAKRNADKPRDAPKAEKPREATEAKPEPEEPEKKGLSCKQTPGRKECKANPEGCIYDTALGCYSKHKK